MTRNDMVIEYNFLKKEISRLGEQNTYYSQIISTLKYRIHGKPISHKETYVYNNSLFESGLSGQQETYAHILFYREAIKENNRVSKKYKDRARVLAKNLGNIPKSSTDNWHLVSSSKNKD